MKPLIDQEIIFIILGLERPCAVRHKTCELRGEIDKVDQINTLVWDDTVSIVQRERQIGRNICNI